MKTKLAVFTAGVLLSAISLFAHHAFQAEYDSAKPVKVTGVVKRVEWMNPHIWFYVDVKDSNGKVVNWAVETAPPNVLYRRGWTKNSLKVGDIVTVEGYLPREEGLHHINGRNATLADGRKIFAGSGVGLPGGPAY